MFRLFVLLCSTFAALACCPTHAGAASEPTEKEPVLDAAAIVQPALLSGPHFTVDPKVAVGGYMARFRISTEFGPLQADSTQLLAIRVNEIPAIETLDRASRSGAFAHALAERGKKTGMAIVHVVSHPVDSIVGLPMGVARYFKKQLDTWASRAQSVGDRSQRVFENKGDPFRAPDGPMTAGRNVPNALPTAPAAIAADPSGADGDQADSAEPVAAEDEKAGPAAASPPEKKNRAWYARAGSEVGREAKRYLKYNQERNEMAKYLGIDPNTSNPYVTERLNTLAWAAVWGNFSAGEALSDITGTAATVIADSGLVDQFVLTHTPEQIRERNEKNLASVCSDEYGIRQFSRRGAFNDSLRTQLVDLLMKLQASDGCNDILELGLTTRSEVEARYIVDSLALILRHAPGATGGRLIIAGAAVVYLTPKGSLVLPLPVDYLSWGADIAHFFDRPEFGRADKIVLIGGDASLLAQRRLTERGWNLQLRAPYDGAPAYAEGEFARISR